MTDVDKAVDADDGLDAVDPVDTAKNLEDWKWEGGDAQLPGQHGRQHGRRNEARRSGSEGW